MKTQTIAKKLKNIKDLKNEKKMSALYDYFYAEIFDEVRDEVRDEMQKSTAQNLIDMKILSYEAIAAATQLPIERTQAMANAKNETPTNS